MAQVQGMGRSFSGPLVATATTRSQPSPRSASQPPTCAPSSPTSATTEKVVATSPAGPIHPAPPPHHHQWRWGPWAWPEAWKRAPRSSMGTTVILDTKPRLLATVAASTARCAGDCRQARRTGGGRLGVQTWRWRRHIVLQFRGGIPPPNKQGSTAPVPKLGWWYKLAA